jgi:hypothetical protein
MTGDIGLNANALAAIIICYSIACAFVGAAITFGIIERRDRKNAARSKHKPLNIIA